MTREANSLSDLLAEGMALLNNAEFADSARESRLLLQGASGLDHATLIGRLERPASEQIAVTFHEYIARRLRQEPIYRIIGEREFYGLRFRLSCETLEPRDDTECLIGTVLERIEDKNLPLKFLDLGTGSGIVAVTLLHELPAAKAVATDLSQDALRTALKNANLNEVGERLKTIQSDWLKVVEGTFDFIASNPPYIRSEVVDGLAPEVRDHDPRAALDGGADGLDAYRAILSGAASFLNSGGFLALEIGFDQADSVTKLGAQYGWTVGGLRRDLGGQDRALIFSRV